MIQECCFLWHSPLKAICLSVPCQNERIHLKTCVRPFTETLHSLYPATRKWQCMYSIIPSEPFECLSVCPSVSTSFLDSNLSSFWPIFFKLCMDTDIREEWFRIAKRLTLYIDNRVMALDWCKNVFFLSIFRTNRWILIKFCICIDICKLHVVSNVLIFCQFLTEVYIALDRHQNFVYAQYLVI